MKKGISISFILMTAIAAYCTYGIIYSYFSLDKIMWGAVFGVLFCIRYMLKWSQGWLCHHDPIY